MEPDGLIDEEVLESNLGLHDQGKDEGYELVGQGTGREEGGEFNVDGTDLTLEGKEDPDRNGTPDLFPLELETRQEGGDGPEGGGGRQSEEDGCSSMLIDCGQSEGGAVVIEPMIGGENSVMETAEMCYDMTLPTGGNHEAHGAPVDYAETYMSSPGEREGELISTVPALPSTFFQTANMDVSGSTAMTASWGELNSPHAKSGYGTVPSSPEDASPGSGNSTDERAFVDSFCEEPSKVECLDIGKDHDLSGPSFQDTGTKNAENVVQSSGLSDTKNEYSCSPTTEDGSHGGERNPSDTRPGKEKGPLGEHSLRRVLSDPVTGAFMDDAMVAMCGHSFGSGGLQRVLETHSCVSCGASVPPKTLVPNFALRAAVLAYKHEDHVWQPSSMKGTKRRREQFEMREGSEPKGTSSDHAGSAENTHSDSRAKGVQFPFVVGERVIIKGNKRTPERFFGMEAIITSQCLNGWYLVRTLDTGESVRLQYRSLQKLGEIDSPLTSEPRLSTEQQVDSGCGPLSMDNLDGYGNDTKPASENDPDSQSLASGQQNEAFIHTSIAAESVQVQSSERTANGTINQSLLAADGESYPTLTDGNPADCSQEGERNANNSHVVYKTEDNMDVEVINAMEPLQGADDQKALDVVSEKSSSDLPKSIDTVLGEPDGDQLLNTGLEHSPGAKGQVGASRSSPEAPILKNGAQGQPNLVSTADGLTSAVDGDKLPAVINNQANGNEALRTRSRRTSYHFKSCTTSGGFLQDSDPYRKVYTSGSRRRSTKEESGITVIPEHLPAGSKSFLKGGTNNNERGSEKAPVKGVNVGGLSTGGKQGRDLKLKSANEILHIMRKDMLKLEQQIPRNYLLRSWRVRRVRWQKQVQASHTVLELGAQVRDFRYSLLLTSAGGMSDEEWDMRIAQIMESGDVELLVSLWGRLYGDVHKWLESRPKGLSSKGIQLGKLFTAQDMNLLQKQDHDSSSCVTMSSVHMTTAATLAAVDAVTERQHDVESSIKALLTSTMKLLQQQSRSELSTVREALEWEKRHITAKLQHLEQRFANLQGTSELSGSEDNPVHDTGSLVIKPQTGQCASASTDQTMSQGIASLRPHGSQQGYETDEYESDTPLPPQDADGEATDMSDSD